MIIMFQSSLTALALLMLNQHGSFAFASPTPPTRGINWYACTQNASIATTCGTLDVPLDYTAVTSNESLILHLVKVCSDLAAALKPEFTNVNL